MLVGVLRGRAEVADEANYCQLLGVKTLWQRHCVLPRGSEEMERRNGELKAVLGPTRIRLEQ